MLNFKDIAKIFEEIELRLIASLKRNLMHHKAEEIREDRQWTAWQAIKLQNLQKFRRENRQIMQEYSDKIDADTRQLMTEQFREGEQEAEAVAGGEPAASVPDVHFFGVNTPKMERLIEDITTLEQNVETAAVRNMDDVYRTTLNRVQLAMGSGSMTLNEAIDLATRDFLDKGINCIVYKDSRRVNIADYVRMVLRTTSTRAQLQGKSKRFAELGYDTVLISQYGGCSKTCEPWQGKVYIDDVFTVWSGEISGDSGKSRYCGKWFPLLSSAIRGGLFHPNCRHTMGLYIDGVTKIPPPIPAEQMQRQRELEARQRAMERKIRKLKRLEAGTQDPQAVKEYGRKLKQAQQEMKTFVDENHDVLRRDYEREKVYGGEDNKSQYMSMRRIDWSKATPTHHEQKEYDDICEYAKQKGINIYNVNAFDGDMDILKEQIDMISSMKNEYAINKKITISFKDMYDEDFAETVKNTIYFNKKALRNRKITNEILNADNALAATDIRGIAVHEMGHIISHQYTFHSGKVSAEKTDPPVIEYIDKDGWVRRAKLSELDKFPQFTGKDRTFLEEVKRPL